jgi:16S rRNA (cytosine967-C5)-methyltransferase
VFTFCRQGAYAKAAEDQRCFGGSVMTARESAMRIILQLEQRMDRLEDKVAENLSATQLSHRDRKFLYNLVSGVIRHRSLLDWKASKLYAGTYKKTLDKFKIILRLALYELDYLEFIPPHATVNEYVSLAKKYLPAALKGVVNGILRTYLRQGKSLQPLKAFKYPETRLAVAYSFPEWMIKRWLHFWGQQETENLCRVLNERPEFDLKINLSKISYHEFISVLAQNKIAFIPSSFFEHGVKVTDIQKVMALDLFTRGLCSVQDESGQLVVDLLQVAPGDIILDACAAPGSKYTNIKSAVSDNMNCIALEINADRLMRVKENCRRIGVSEYFLVAGDAVLPPFKKIFTKILVDAPCSGLGTIQKHPDIKWRRTLEDIMHFQDLQVRMLLSLEQILANKGVLLYSTCTIEPSENEEVIALFLKRSVNKYEFMVPPERFKEMTTEQNFVRTWPHRHNMEGAFAALLRRVS